MKKIIYIPLFAATLIGLGSFVYIENSTYSEQLKSIRTSGGLRKLNTDLAGLLGNPLAGKTNALICEESSRLVIQVAEANNKKFWAEKSDELLTKNVTNWREWSSLNAKNKKTKTDERRQEEIQATIDADSRIRDAINIGLKKPFWVSADKAAEDYGKSCLGR